MKNKHAAALAKQRWDNVSTADRSAAASRAATARHARKTSAERSAESSRISLLSSKKSRTIGAKKRAAKRIRKIVKTDDE